jgi:hypothetical protein
MRPMSEIRSILDQIDPNGFMAEFLTYDDPDSIKVLKRNVHATDEEVHAMLIRVEAPAIDYASMATMSRWQRMGDRVVRWLRS